MSDHGSNATHLSGAQLEALAAGEPRTQFEVHLAACSSCREELEALVRENAWFRDELAHAAAGRSAARQEAPRASNWGLYGIAAAVVLAATLSFVALLNARSEPEGETAQALPAAKAAPEAPAVFALGGEGEGAEAVKPPAPPDPAPVTPPEPAKLPPGADFHVRATRLLDQAQEALARKDWAAAAELLKEAEKFEPDPKNATLSYLQEQLRRGPAMYEGRTAGEWFKELLADGASKPARAALAKLGSETLAVVAPALNEGDGASRKLAEEVLATLELREADLPRAAELLLHPHFGVRRTTVRLLGKLAPTSPEALRLLRGALDDRDRAVSEAAEEALAEGTQADRDRFQALLARCEEALATGKANEAVMQAKDLLVLSRRIGDARLQALAERCLAQGLAQAKAVEAAAAQPSGTGHSRPAVEVRVGSAPVTPLEPASAPIPPPAPPSTSEPHPRRAVGEASAGSAPVTPLEPASAPTPPPALPSTSAPNPQRAVGEAGQEAEVQKAILEALLAEAQAREALKAAQPAEGARVLAVKPELKLVMISGGLAQKQEVHAVGLLKSSQPAVEVVILKVYTDMSLAAYHAGEATPKIGDAVEWTERKRTPVSVGGTRDAGSVGEVTPPNPQPRGR
ncbi:MAG: hypothetical protein AMXMBFR7_41390 [Planctomycetota bacterium]